MQPLTLHIEGLHSFRHAADIDLAALGQHGLFGIFGPVGSGKSTLLDAMTLALYGQVDRLIGRSKRGIVNHQAKRCEVRLRFRARGDEWEVQRAYRADKDGLAVRTHSRLSRASGLGLAVLADKEREVNSRIEALLGLSAEDFMRAVVLPQGRFMQFLHLQGTDRRRMLQRIFHLEPFGEGLRSRVKKETDRVGGVLQHALGEIAGLGSADSTSLAAAASLVETTTAEAGATDAAFKETVVALETASKGRQHHLELDAARQAAAAHEGNASEIAAERARLEAAQRIRPILTHLQRRDEAAQAFGTVQEELEKIQTRHEEALIEAQQGQAERERTRLARSEARPGLESERDSLKRATSKMSELRDAVATVGKLSRQRGQLKRKVDSGARSAQTQETNLAGLVSRRTAMRSAFSELVVTVEDRTRVRAAEDAQQALEQARQQVEAARSQFDAAALRWNEAKASEERAQSALNAGMHRSQRATEDGQRLLAQLEALNPVSEAARAVRHQGLVERILVASDTVAKAGVSLASAREALALAEEAVEALPADGLDRLSLAGLLSRELVPGEACQVCGATDHPHPAAKMHEADVLSALEIHAGAQAEVSARSRAQVDAQSRVQRAIQDAEILAASIPAVLETSEGPVLAELLKRESLAHGSLMHAISRTERSIQGLRPGLEDARALHISAAAHRAAAGEEKARIETELASGLASEGEAWGALTDALGEVTVFDLPRLVTRINESDSQRQRLEPELTALEKELERAQRSWEERQRLNGENTLALDRVAREHDTTETKRVALLEEIRSLCPSGDPDAALADVLGTLSRLEQAEAAARESHEVSRATVLETTAARAAAVAAHEAASAASQRATADLRAASAAAGLDASDPGLMERALPGEDIEARRAATRLWFETRAALSHRVSSLERVDLPSVSESALEEARNLRDANEQRWRTAETERIRATEQLEGLQTRASRFNELTNTSQALTTRSERLSTLMRLLRGDRFVEYVANDYLTELCEEASRHLGTLTRGRYALELDESAAFLVADLDAGGAVRPASSLSGGETFVTSLALALALSTQVQRHNDQALEFFFLDEGFGSLDPESLDRVMTAIEALADEQRVIGLISHVGAVRERVPRYLSLTCPRDGGGTRVEVVDS